MWILYQNIEMSRKIGQNIWIFAPKMLKSKDFQFWIWIFCVKILIFERENSNLSSILDIEVRIFSAKIQITDLILDKIV